MASSNILQRQSDNNGLPRKHDLLPVLHVCISREEKRLSTVFITVRLFKSSGLRLHSAQTPSLPPEAVSFVNCWGNMLEFKH